MAAKPKRIAERYVNASLLWFVERVVQVTVWIRG